MTDSKKQMPDLTREQKIKLLTEQMEQDEATMQDKDVHMEVRIIARERWLAISTALKLLLLVG